MTDIEVDRGLEHDSSYGTDEQSELTSLSSSITAYHYENGRRYHAYHAGKYYTPNDDQELDREDMKHHWYKIILAGQLHLAPLSSPQHILDLGTGGGLWCMEMADLYPSAQIIGTDLSKIQPDMVPPNLQFEIDDWDDDWAYTHQFDFIHSRFNSTAVSSWQNLARKALENLRPSGWVQFADLTNPPGIQSDDGFIPPNRQLLAFFETLTSGCARVGRDLHAPKKWAALLQETGFVNVEERVFKIPIGGWPRDRKLKEAGVFEMETLREGLPAIGMGFCTRVLQWQPQQVENFFEGVRRELDDRSLHFWLPMHVVWGQKLA